MRWLVVLLLVASCGKGESTPDAAPAPAPKPERKGGRIRVGDKFESIVPEVIHEAKMDLFIGCKKIVDEAKAQGHADVPICYDDKARKKDAVKVLRVERRLGTAGDAMRYLGQQMEATHFIAEGDGSMYQLLDLAYAARREGQNRADEVRILAMGGNDGHAADVDTERLLKALGELYPAAKIETVEVGAKP